MDKGIVIGCAYYPDHWPRERWPEDIELMKAAGIKILRLAELSWAALEPEDGKFDFTWLDDFIGMAGKKGIRFILGTPIEASPIWLRHKHPDVVRTDEFGRIHGGRGMHCHNNSSFIYYVERIVTKMVEHYHSHPYIIGWQIDNELRNVECYCDECAAAFRDWLKERYGTIERLNEAWGTCFWSQHYNHWEQVNPPYAGELTVSVSQQLDFIRFGSDSTVKHLNRQVAIIKKYAPQQFVTHNCLGWYDRLNTYDLAKQLDFIGWDSYPNVDGDNVIECFLHDHFRAVKRQPHWVLEQKNGYFNYSDYNLAIEPGLVRWWTYQDIARGANGVLLYRWRSNKFSIEQNPNGLLRHDGTPRRAYFEIAQLTKELESFSEELVKTKVQAKIAIIYDYHQMWAFSAHKQYKNFDYRGHLLTYYRQIVRMGLNVDLIEPTTNLSNYDVVIAPSLAMISDEIYQNLDHFVKNGGCLIIGARSGMKTWSNTTIEEAWPGLLKDMSGVEIDEFEVLPDYYTNTVEYKGKKYPVKVWLDMLKPITAKTLATYTEKFYSGRTAISKNNYGEGTVYYVGVMANEELIADFLRDVFSDIGLPTTLFPEEIYISSRENDNVRFTFYQNFNREPVKILLREPGFDCIKGVEVEEEVTIKGLDVLIVKSYK